MVVAMNDMFIQLSDFNFAGEHSTADDRHHTHRASNVPPKCAHPLGNLESLTSNLMSHVPLPKSKSVWRGEHTSVYTLL
jgi:hypothetical protein